MSWTRYDDEMPMNRKVAWLRSHGVHGIAALGTHMLLNTWSRHEGHQGFIPNYVPEQLVGPLWRKLIDLLADGGCGMLTACDNGWMINDYDEYGDRDDGVPVDVKKARLSKVRAEAGRAGGFAKAAKRPSKPRSKQVAELEAKPKQSPAPVPEPVPVSTQGSSKGGGSVERDQEPPLFCKKHPNGHDGPCGLCADARRVHDAWVEAGTQRVLDQAWAAAEAVKNCPHRCVNGWIENEENLPVRRCNHQPLIGVAS